MSAANRYPEESRLVNYGYNQIGGFFSYYFHLDKKNACHLDFMEVTGIPPESEDGHMIVGGGRLSERESCRVPALTCGCGINPGHVRVQPQRTAGGTTESVLDDAGDVRQEPDGLQGLWRGPEGRGSLVGRVGESQERLACHFCRLRFAYARPGAVSSPTRCRFDRCALNRSRGPVCDKGAYTVTVRY